MTKKVAFRYAASGTNSLYTFYCNLQNIIQFNNDKCVSGKIIKWFQKESSDKIMEIFRFAQYDNQIIIMEKGLYQKA